MQSTNSSNAPTATTATTNAARALTLMRTQMTRLMQSQSQNSCECSCGDDISLQTANTGIGTVSLACPYLDGVTGVSGSYVTVFTSGSDSDGSIIKSIVIKAIQPTLQGMVRLFVTDNKALTPTVTLITEVPIPIVPQSRTTPIPAPQYIMFQIVLPGNFKLNPGYSLLASTQNAQSFNIIVEGLDITYPETPDSCCNFKETAANTGNGIVSVASPYLTANPAGTIVPIFTAGNTFSNANGSFIRTIAVKALQSTHEGAVRLFVSPTAEDPSWTLLQEIWIPQTVQSAFQPSFKKIVAARYNLEAGYVIGASTQNAESFAITIEAEDWLYGNL